jgi:hypothetical protein
MATCSLCGATFSDFFNHVAGTCVITFDIRNGWWNDIFNSLCDELTAELCAHSEEDLYIVLLGGSPRTTINKADAEFLKFRNYKLLQDASAHFYRSIHVNQNLPVRDNDV